VSGNSPDKTNKNRPAKTGFRIVKKNFKAIKRPAKELSKPGDQNIVDGTKKQRKCHTESFEQQANSKYQIR
jgi:hypothetical protein